MEYSHVFSSPHYLGLNSTQPGNRWANDVLWLYANSSLYSHLTAMTTKNIIKILIQKSIFLFFLVIVVSWLWSKLLAYNQRKSFADWFLSRVLFNPRLCGLEKTAMRVFHFSIIIEKVNTATALITSIQLGFWLKTGKKGIRRHFMINFLK